MKKSYIMGFTAIMIWATNSAVAKVLVNDMPGLEAVGVSSAIAALFLFLYNAVTGKLRILRKYTAKDLLTISALGFLGMFLYSALYYFGLEHLPTQVCSVLNYLWPIWLVVFSVLINKEKMNAWKILALVCSFIGVIILSWGNTGITGFMSIVGMISVTACAACYSLFCVLNNKHDYDQSVSMMIIWAVSAVFSVLLGLLTEKWVPITGTAWIGMSWLGVMINAVAYLLWALALKQQKNTATLANMAYLDAPLSLAAIYLLVGEHIKPNAIFAIIFIVGGVILQGIFGEEKRSV